MALNTTPATWVSGAVVTAAQMNTEVRDAIAGIEAAWTAYTPALTATTTNPTLGTGNSITGNYQRYGKTITGNFDILFGTPGFVAGSGTYTVSLPVAATAASVTSATTCGSGLYFDASAAFYTFTLQFLSTTTVRCVITGGTGLSAVAPVVPANNDQLHANFTYQAA